MGYKRALSRSLHGETRARLSGTKRRKRDELMREILRVLDRMSIEELTRFCDWLVENENSQMLPWNEDCELFL
jgi:hypothetical protein